MRTLYLFLVFVAFTCLASGVLLLKTGLPFSVKPNIGMYVVSLDGVEGARSENKGRLQSFLDSWRQTCGTRPKISVCPGMLHSARGYGLTMTYVKCLSRALSDGVDVAYFFEDDARLLSRDFCEESTRIRLLEKFPEDGFLFLLGCHQLKKLSTSVEKDAVFQPLTASYGTYSFAVPKRSLEPLLNGYLRDLSSGQKALSPDVSFYSTKLNGGGKIYICNPAISKHAAGFSNTWKKHRSEIIS